MEFSISEKVSVAVLVAWKRWGFFFVNNYTVEFDGGFGQNILRISCWNSRMGGCIPGFQGDPRLHPIMRDIENRVPVN